METQVPPLGQEDPLEKGMATHSACLENSIDREVWWAAVHGIAESDMIEWLSLHLKFVRMRQRLKLGYMIKQEGTSRKGETDGDEDRGGLFEGGRSLGALNEEEELGWPKVYLGFFIPSCDEGNTKVLVSGVLMFFLSPERK